MKYAQLNSVPCAKCLILHEFFWRCGKCHRPTYLLCLNFLYIYLLCLIFLNFFYTWVVWKENQTVLNIPIIVLVLFASPFNYTPSWCFLLGFYEAGSREVLLLPLTDELDWLMNNDGLTDVFIDGHEWLILSDCTCVYIHWVFAYTFCCSFWAFLFSLSVRGLFFFLLILFCFLCLFQVMECHFLFCIMKQL